MFRALMNAHPSHLLAPKLFDFAGLSRREDGQENPKEIPQFR